MSKSGIASSEDNLAAGWIARMAKGEADALTALYRLYHRPLLTIFYGILQDREGAEEVLQDTFVKAFHKASSFNPVKGVAFAWLVTIGRRLSIDRIRRNRSRPDSENMEHPELLDDRNHEETIQDVRHGAEYSWLQETLEGLPDRQRVAIQMAFIEGYTHHEIAELTGLPLGTVKSDLYRGLNTLRNNYFGKND